MPRKGKQKAYRERYYIANRSKALLQRQNDYKLEKDARKETEKQAYEKNTKKRRKVMTKYNLLNANEIQSAVRIKYQSNHETKKFKQRHAYDKNPEPKKMQVRHVYGMNPEPKKMQVRRAYGKKPELKKIQKRRAYGRNPERKKILVRRGMNPEPKKMQVRRAYGMARIRSLKKCK